MNEYAARNPEKIRVMHTDVNLKPGGARNMAIKVARGYYIAFCDSDDWVEPDMYEAMYSQTIKYNSDACYCLYRKVTESGKIFPDNSTHYFPTGTINEQERKQIIAFHTTFLPKYIFRRDIFADNDIRFPENLWYEDIYVAALTVPYINTVCCVYKPFYNYFIHAETITTNRNDTKYHDKITVCLMLVEEYKKRGLYERYRDEVNYLYFRKGFIHAALNYIINSSNPKGEAVNEMKRALLSVDPAYRNNCYYRRNIRFAIIDMLISNNISIKLLKYLLKITGYNI
jgi:glycosyltransferase involved in cell wall biosynthesis